MAKLFLTFAFIFVCSCFIYAQTEEDIKKSNLRIDKIKALKVPTKSGLKNIDALAFTCSDVLGTSVGITPQIKNLYYKSIGKNEKQEIDVNIKKPSLDECINLSTTIAQHALSLQKLSDNLPAAVDELGSAGWLERISAGLSLNYSRKAIAIAGEEYLFQSKAIKDIIANIRKSEEDMIAQEKATQIDDKSLPVQQSMMTRNDDKLSEDTPGGVAVIATVQTQNTAVNSPVAVVPASTISGKAETDIIKSETQTHQAVKQTPSNNIEVVPKVVSSDNPVIRPVAADKPEVVKEASALKPAQRSTQINRSFKH